MQRLTVRNLSVNYGRVAAVQGVSLELGASEVLAIVGPNGAGKSSLLKAIVGLVRPALGDIVYEGLEVKHMPVESRARVGLVLIPEGRGILEPLSVEDNLRLGAYPSGRISRDDMSKRLEQAYDLFPILGQRRSQFAGTLSGGEAAMLAIARALMSRPKLLLLDEPTLGLAPLATANVYQALAKLKKSDVSMVLVEEKVIGLLNVADRVLVMRRGQRQHLAQADALSPGQLQALYFGEEAGA